MSAIVSITDDAVFTALRSFLLKILPVVGSDGIPIEVIRAQSNRVPEPKGVDFVVMTPLFQERLRLNVDNYQDVILTGSINQNTLTVTEINFDVLTVGQQLFSPNIALGTAIFAIKAGTGGVGIYTVNPAQIVSSQSIYAGIRIVNQNIRYTIQLDVHGPLSSVNSQAITSLFRDYYGNEAFSLINSAIAPLYTSDPRQTPFINAENQYEFRWSIDAVLQVNQRVIVPQQFADQLSVGLISVDATYPPGA